MERVVLWDYFEGSGKRRACDLENNQTDLLSKQIVSSHVYIRIELPKNKTFVTFPLFE